MAFKDITKVLYDGKVKIDYKDKAHRYYARPRIDWELPEADPKAWGKIMYPKGTTTLIGDTLEKKGLMTWPMGLALRELFGFYDFTAENGERRTGFSKGVGTLWADPSDHSLGRAGIETEEEMLELVLSASKAWSRKQQKGADIGSVVHDAIEHFVLEQPFDIGEQYMWNIKEAWPLPDTDADGDKWVAERARAMEEFAADVECATKAFEQFVIWWNDIKPVLYGAEDLLYSLEHNICGTYDACLGISRKDHPVYKDQPLYRWKTAKMTGGTQSDRYEVKELDAVVRCMTDWKTSNASASKEAAMPEGVNYQYFVQSAIYEMMNREMGGEPADDLLIVSARKDGGFSLVYASELGLTIEECIDWAKAVILSYRAAEKTKAGLLKHAEPKLDSSKEAF